MRNFPKTRRLCATACVPAAMLVSAALLGAAGRTEHVVSPGVVDLYGKLPLSFEANHGQTAPQVKFLSRGRGYTLFLTEDAATVLSLSGKKTHAVLRMRLRGANAHAPVTGADPLPGRSNYFIGNDPAKWRADVPTYGAVKYTGVYPGIDLVYHGNQRLLEYDFVLAPGADPRIINLQFQGSQKLSVNPDGALVIGMGAGEVIEHAPVVYQETGGRRQTLSGRYVLRGKGRVGFQVAEYDRSRTLVIDPTLVYSTYLGGRRASSVDQPIAIAVDASGNAYVTGQTYSSDFPVTPGAFQTVSRAIETSNVFVTKLNAYGSALVYSTYLGGSAGINGSPGWAMGAGIAVDALGSAYVTGNVGFSNFPTTPGAFQTAFPLRIHGRCAFVTKLNTTGSALVYSTYLGGREYDPNHSYDTDGSSIAVDASGNAYVTGQTHFSPYFPVTSGAFQTTTRIGHMIDFVTKLNSTGSALVYSTLLGGATGDLQQGYGIAVDPAGNAYVTGFTDTADFPVTAGAFKTTNVAGTSIATATRLNAAGSALVYSTYLGGSVESFGYGIAVDAVGDAYVTGVAAPDFPTTPGAFKTTNSGGGGFVAKLNPSGSALVYSTFLGGTVNPGGGYVSQGRAIAVDALGGAYVTGMTTSSDFPTTPDAMQTSYGGSFDAFLTRLNPAGSALLYSTYLGGTGREFGSGIALDTSGNAYVTGGTNSADFPTSTGAFQTTNAGGTFNNAGFVTKLGLGAIPGPRTAAHLSGLSGNDGWHVSAVTVTLAAMPGNSPVSTTYYNVDNGAWQGYRGPFSVSGDGIHQLLFYSTDTAGHQEPTQGLILRIDTARPQSRAGALPATVASPNFGVQWSGTDATSGVKTYTVYVSDNGGAFTRWLSNVTSTQAWYSGSLLHSYAFYSMATDLAGNVENVKTVAEAATRVPQIPGDINGDGRIDCTDIARLKASFGKSTVQPGFDAGADVNKDGTVNVIDLATVTQKLAPGTRCL